MKKIKSFKEFSNNKPVLKSVPVVIFIAIIIVVLALDGEICIFKSVTGLPCPGCGMTRAYLCLFILDIKAAFFYHPLFFLPAVILILFSLKNHNKIINSLYKSDAVWLVLLFLTLTVWIIRMIFMFPSKAPMDINRDAILLKIIARIF